MATKTSEYPKTPELDKMKKVQDESQSLGAFLDWLQNERKIILCEYNNKDEHYPFPIYKSIEQILAEYFKIDLKKCENERRAILAHIQKK